MLKNVYYSLLYPHLVYASVMNKILILQKRALRILSSKDALQPVPGPLYPPDPLFHELEIMKINDVFKLQVHSLLSYGHLIPGERACTGHTCMIKKFFQGPSKGRYIPWAVPEDSGYWLSGVLRGWSANG